MDFKDTTSEIYREYIFASGEKIRINNPLRLNVSTSGGHRVEVADGGYYIPPTWLAVRWMVKPDTAKISF